MSVEDLSVVTHQPNEKKQSLLKKYDIPIDHLSYEYIGVCTNSKELERIVRILRSGEEGSYPHLTKTAEARLSLIKPNSVVLRVPEPVINRYHLPLSERNKIDAELSDWLGEMKLLERDLKDEKLDDDELPRPAVRVVSSVNEFEPKPGKKETKRLSSCDYAGWDKYDADTELERIELAEEQKRAEAKRRQRLRDTELEQHRTENVVNKSLLTTTEQQILGVKEREKGNEAFRAGDYAEALRLYSASVILNGDIDAYNNRAITHIKLKNFKEAIKDCNVVLEIDSLNVKALLRQGLALEKLDKLEEALKDYEKVLTIDPTNVIAISSVKKLRKDDETKKTRLTIEEIKD